MRQRRCSAHALRLPRGLTAARRRAAGIGRARSRASRRCCERRIRERMPAVYLTQRCWFAGLPMYVDERVLIPRSPIAELIERRFEPWIDPARVRRILDLGTGSGCIAIACALRISARARRCGRYLAPMRWRLPAHQYPRHRLQRRVRAVRSDHFALSGAPATILLSAIRRMWGGVSCADCRRNTGHEPRLALAAGADGLDSVRIILRDAAAHLNPGGILIVEVGNTERALRRAFPRSSLHLAGVRARRRRCICAASASSCGRRVTSRSAMSGNTIGRLFAVTTFGESHGAALGCIVDGCPPGTGAAEARPAARCRPAPHRHLAVRQPAARGGCGADSLGRVRGPHHRRADRPAGREWRCALARLRTAQATAFVPGTPTTPISTSTASAIIAAAAAPRRARPSCGWRPAPIARKYLAERLACASTAT